MPARKIFISYSHQDENLKHALGAHLAPLLLQGRIHTWNDQEMRAGTSLFEEIKGSINSADIVLLLISADYLNSRSCQEEMMTSLDRSRSKLSVAIPIIVRACDWTILPIGQLLAANKDGRPISSAANQDAAWTEVAVAIRQIVNDWDVERLGDLEESPAEGTHDNSVVVPAELIALKAEESAGSGQWIYRKEVNDIDWNSLKEAIGEGLFAAGDVDRESGIFVQTRRWGDKIIVDFQLPKYRNPRRMIIADVSGYSGYPGYQMEVYPQFESLKIGSERLRWMERMDGVRVLRRLRPDGCDFTVDEFIGHLWRQIRALQS